MTVGVGGGQGEGVGVIPPIFFQPKKLKITTYKSVYSNIAKIGP